MPRVDHYRGVHHWRCQPVNGRDDIGVDNYLLPLRGRDNPKQNYIKYFFFHYATYANRPVTRVVTGFVESVYYATYYATTMPNTYATTR